MNKKLILERYRVPGVGVYGVLFSVEMHNGSPFKKTRLMVTCELDWKLNKPNVSCIPDGTYRLMEHPTDHLKLRVINERLGVFSEPVEGDEHCTGTRTQINIEIFNVPSQSEGCIAPGKYHRVVDIAGHNDQLGVVSSRASMNDLMDFWRAEKIGGQVQLDIVWAELPGGGLC